MWKHGLREDFLMCIDCKQEGEVLKEFIFSQSQKGIDLVLGIKWE